VEREREREREKRRRRKRLCEEMREGVDEGGGAGRVW